MKSWKVAIVLAVISLLLAFALAAAQEPVRDFAQLNTRLRPGDTIWVTDAQGREVKGRIAALGADAITLEGGGGEDVLRHRRRHDHGAPRRDSLAKRRADRAGSRRGSGPASRCLASADGADRRGVRLVRGRSTAASARRIGVGIDA